MYNCFQVQQRGEVFCRREPNETPDVSHCFPAATLFDAQYGVFTLSGNLWYSDLLSVDF